MITESDLQREIMALLRRRGLVVLRLNSGRVKLDAGRWLNLCPPGTPDLLVVLPGGASGWIECKTAAGKLSAVQAEFQSDLAGLGHSVLVARSPLDVVDWLDQHNHQTNREREVICSSPIRR